MYAEAVLEDQRGCQENHTITSAHAVCDEWLFRRLYRQTTAFRQSGNSMSRVLQREVSIALPTASSSVGGGSTCSEFHGEDPLCLCYVLSHRSAVESAASWYDVRPLDDRNPLVSRRRRRSIGRTRHGVQVRESNMCRVKRDVERIFCMRRV